MEELTIFVGWNVLSNEEINRLIRDIEALIYVRVSTEMQVEQYSLDSQIDICVERAYSKYGIPKQRLLVIREEGESGDNPNRPGLNFVMYLIEQGIGKRLFILHPNRFSRELTLQRAVTEKIWRLGYALEFIEFDLVKGNPESEFMFNIHGSVSQYQKAKILADSRRGRKQMVMKGKIPGIRRIYGYTYDKDLDTIVENPEEKTVYLQMVDWILNGDEDGTEMSSSAIARELARRGVSAPSSDKWYQSTVSRILKNETYKGTFYYGRTVVETYQGEKKQVPQPRDSWVGVPIPRYIDDATFDKVQKRMASAVTRKGGRPSDLYLLKGLARCGRCGKAVASGVKSKLKNGDTLHYYGCTGKTKKRYNVGTGEPTDEPCRGSDWRQDKIDAIVWDKLKEYLRYPEKWIEAIIKSQGDTKRIEEMGLKRDRLKSQIQKKQTERKRYLVLFGKGTIKEDEIDEYLNPIDREVAIIQTDLDEIEQTYFQEVRQFDELDRIKNSITMFVANAIDLDNPSLERKRQMVRKFIKSIVLYDNNKVVIIWLFQGISPGELDSKKSSLTHNYLTNSEDQCLSIGVCDEIVLGKAQPRTDTIVYELSSRLDELKNLYHVDKLSLIEIEKRTGISWSNIKALFNKQGVKMRDRSENWERKRAEKFDEIYRLNYELDISMNEIYEKYGYTRQFVKAVLATKGYEPKPRKN